MQFDFGNLESPLSGTVFINGNLEPWRDALHSSHKGGTRPSYAVEGMLWVNDTTNPWILNMFDGANDIALGSFDTTTNTFTPSGVSQAAEDISFDNTDSGLTATNVQDAIDEAVGDFSDFEGRADGFATAAQGALADTAVQPVQVLGHISGLTLSNNVSDANNDIDIAPGSAADSTGSVMMTLATTLTKRLDAAWAVGNNNGGLFSGSKANSTWYHVFEIRRPDTGVVDAGWDTSVIAENRPVAYTQFRRIGSVRTDGSGSIIGFIQLGDRFYWKSVAVSASGTSVSSATLITVLAPLGIKTIAEIQANSPDTDLDWLYFSSPDQNDDAASLTNFHVLANDAGGRMPANIFVPTNTSSQIRARSNGTISTNVNTRGYIDYRGQY